MIISKYISSYETLIAGRFVSGLASGTFNGILPIYVYEMTPSRKRYLIGPLQQIFLVIYLPKFLILKNLLIILF